MTRRFQKSVGPSVRLCLSVRPFVTLTKIAYSSYIIDSGNITHISGERANNPLQENETIFSKNSFQKFLERIFKKNLYLHKMPTPSL